MHYKSGQKLVKVGSNDAVMMQAARNLMEETEEEDRLLQMERNKTVTEGGSTKAHCP